MFDAVSFPGGGNRCYWQGGFWEAAASVLDIAPARVVGVSGGAFAASYSLLQLGPRVRDLVRIGCERGHPNFDWRGLRRGEAFPVARLLWVFRVVLLASILLHVAGAIVLSRRKRRARGTFPRRSLPLRTFAARTMFVTGNGLLVFVIIHVLDLTLGAHPVASERFQAAHAYANLVASLKRPAVASFYVAAMVCLALHLGHGPWTASHDVGTTGQRSRRLALW